MKKILLAAAVLIAAPTLVEAQTKKGNIEWGLFAGPAFFSHGIKVDTMASSFPGGLTTFSNTIDDDAVLGARVGWGLTDRFEIELIYDEVDTNLAPDSTVVVNVETITANFLWNFWSSERDLVGLYGSGGIGTIDISGDGRGMTVEDDDTVVALGVGVRTFLGRRIAFRYEFRAKDYTAFNQGVTDLELTWGLTVFHRRK